MIKELSEKSHAHFWIINHLAKDAKNQSIDQIMNMTARGGSAWGSDAQWTALIGKADPDDIDSATILKIDKERIGTLRGSEIVFTATFQSDDVADKFGDFVEVHYPVVGMQKSKTETRKKEEFKKKISDAHQSIIDKIEEQMYQSGADVHKKLKMNKQDYYARLSELITDGRVVEQELPEGMRGRGKTTFLSVPSKEKN